MSFISTISTQTSYSRISKTRKSLKRLSSGKRINSAADDAAGLAISTKMSSQQRGIRQAQRNIQDGNSLLQTAEQGLSEINKILQRMRELSVQSANDVNTSADRKEIQKEVEQLKEEINLISNNTEFNTKKLLKGPSKAEVISRVSEKELQPPSQLEWELEFESNKFVQSISATNDGGFIIGGINNHNQGVDVQESWVVKVNSNGETQWKKTFKDGDYNQVHDIVELQNGDFVFSSRKGGSFAERHTLLYKLDENGNLLNKKKAYSGTEFLLAFDKTDNGEILAAGTESGSGFTGIKFNTDFYGLEYYGELNNPPNVSFKGATDIIETSDDGVIIVGYEKESGVGGGFINKYDSNGDLEWEDRSLTEIHDVTQTEKGSYFALSEEGIYKFDNNGNVEIVNDKITHEQAWTYSHRTRNKISETLDGNLLVGTDDKYYKLDSEGNIIWDKQLDNSFEVRSTTQLSDGGYVVVNGEYKLVKHSHEYPDLKEKNTFQVGSNSGNNLEIQMADITTQTLSIEDLSLVTQENSEQAIDKLDNAIKKVTSERSRFGSYQNRLDHMSSNLNNYDLNLLTSKSRIEDADMAKEVMDMVKENLLLSVSRSIQSMSVMQNQQVLKLFQ